MCQNDARYLPSGAVDFGIDALLPHLGIVPHL
jgi:hypothetical protein